MKNTQTTAAMPDRFLDPLCRRAPETKRLASCFAHRLGTIRDHGIFILAIALLAVSGLVTPTPASGQLTLTWSNSDITVLGFDIESSTDAVNFTQITQVPATPTSYLDAGLVSGTTYYYRVRAYNSAGNSDYSNVASGTAPSTVVSVPSSPSNLLLTPSVSPFQVSLSWVNVSGATGFKIERANSPNGPWSQIADIAGSGTASYQDSGLWDNQSYYYRIRAYNSAGTSGYSAITSAATHAHPVLLGHWSFDEGSGSVAADMSGNGNDGVVSNATWTTGICDQALDFNGTNARVVVPDSPTLDPTTGITVALWIAPISWTGIPYLMQKGSGLNQYRLFARHGHLIFNVARIYLDAPLPPTNFWSHIAGTYNGSVMSLFVDGQLVTQQVANVSMATTTDPLCIGSNWASTNGVHYFDGAIDDVRIYGRALFPREIQILADPYTTVTVLSPNGGETITSGTTYSVVWGAPTNAVSFTLNYSVDGGNSWLPIASNVTSESYAWQVPVPVGAVTNGLIQVVGYDGYDGEVGRDTSDNPFTIQP